MTKQEKDAKGIITIRNNEYMKVAGRVLEMHAKYPDCVSITSEILDENDSCLTVKSTVVVTDEKGAREFSGHAREYFDFDDRKSVNFAFALENAETSAIGRAIGAAGVGIIPGSAFASADEIQRLEARTKARESQIPTKTEDEETPIQKIRTELRERREKLNWQPDDIMALAKDDFNVSDWKNLTMAQLRKLIDKCDAELKKAQ